MKIFSQIVVLFVTALLGYGARFLQESPELRGRMTILDMSLSENQNIILTKGEGEYLIEFTPNNSCPAEGNGCINKPGRAFVLPVIALEPGGKPGSFEVCNKIVDIGQLGCLDDSWTEIGKNDYYNIDSGTSALVRINSTVSLRGGVMYWKADESKLDGYIVGLPYQLSVHKKGINNSVPIVVDRSR